METNSPYTQTSDIAQTRSNPYIIPASILLGFAMIALALFFSGATLPLAGNTEEHKEATPAKATTDTKSIRPVDESDHILGNPNAPIIIVEYSDFDCPFCKNFHNTMNKIMDEYGAQGKVAWVYRHFPLEQIHPNAPIIALASECVAQLAGNDAFWKFTNTIFDMREARELTNMTKIDDYAEKSGVDRKAFETCVASGQYKDLVNEDFQDAINAGVRGTPYSVVLAGGQQGPINGAQPYEAVKQIVETLLTQMGDQ